MDTLTRARNFLMAKKYTYILKPIFFQIDPEKIHDVMAYFLKFLGKWPLTRKIASWMWGYQNTKLEQEVLGIKFKNPIGLSAGFDKNAEMTSIIPSLGFGYEEVGSITGKPCAGNPKPRLWRLKKSQSLAVYYGLKNDGCEAIAQRLTDKNFSFPVGVSIAKTNSPDTVDEEKGIADYFKAYQTMQPIGDYLTINTSCPNAFGGQPFCNSQKLDRLLEKIFSIPKTKPVFLKLSPDLSLEELDKILETVARFRIDGFVCTNLTKVRDNSQIIDKYVPEKGGLSGKIVENMSDKMIQYIYQKSNGKYIIIGVGGIFTAEDAYKKIKAGATLLQLITGMIFKGPQTVSDINLGLVKLLERDGYKNISEAIGQGNS